MRHGVLLRQGRLHREGVSARTDITMAEAEAEAEPEDEHEHEPGPGLNLNLDS